MGWVIALLMAAMAWIGLWRWGRVPRAALEIVGAALLLALAGYGWQGSPGMPGTPAGSASR